MKKLWRLCKPLAFGLFMVNAGLLNAQVTNTIADQAYAGFNNAFIRQADGLTFYKTSLNNNEKDYFWQQALDIQSAQDNYFRTNSQTNRTLITNLLNAFLQQNKSNNTTNVQSWEWNNYNDDLFWGAVAFCRGYEYTGNPTFLSQAEYAFNLTYNHTGTGNWGWDSQLGGGIWWSRDKEHKETLSNGPGIVTACYLYQFTGNQTYLDKAIQIYNWLRATLFNANTGAVYSKISAAGTVDYADNVFNSGSFGGAANFLYQITGNISYFNDAKKAFDYVKNTKFNNQILYATSRNGTENAEYIRWLGEFVRQNNLWNEYYPWMKLNADTAWNRRRTDLNITWNDWRVQSPSDNSTTNESNSAVVIQEVTPIVQNIPATIQAESYNFMKGIIVETTTDTGGGLNVGSLDTGDYVEYVLRVPTTGSYLIGYRVAGTVAGSVAILQNGQTLVTTALPSTGGWQVWQDVTTTVNLTAGIQSIRLRSVAGGWNLNRLNITRNTNCAASTITPYQNVNNNGWQQVSNATLAAGQSISLGPQSVDGYWSWTGPNGYIANTREITINNIQANQAGTYRATFTNTCGGKSTRDFIVTVTAPCAATTIVPYINVNNGGWQQVSNGSSAVGGTINFGPQPFEGTWSWTGPNGYNSTAREITIANIQANQFGTYIATYTNACGTKGTRNFVITNTQSTAKMSASETSEDVSNNESSFSMYPNPNEGILNIELNNKRYNTLHIYTSTGVLVYSKQLKGESTLNVDLRNIVRTGVYMVSLQGNNGVSTKKLIVK